MTASSLNDYYKKHEDIYTSIINTSSSVVEAIMKINIYGYNWTCWDWCLFFATLISLMHNSINKQTYYDLFIDFIHHIRTTNLLDDVMTNKKIILNIIYVINNSPLKLCCSQDDIRQILCKMLIAIFKKFPNLWHMSWMHAKNKFSKNSQKYHRLKNAALNFKIDKSDINDKYSYSDSQLYDKFLKLYDDFQSNT